MESSVTQSMNEPEPEAIDDELAKLPPPPRAQRTLTLAIMLVTAALALFLAWAVQQEAAFALQAAPTASAVDLTNHNLEPGTWVSGSVALGAIGGVSFDRPLVQGTERILPVVGTGARLWVAVHSQASQHDTGRFVPPAQISGHVVSLTHPGLRYRGVKDSVVASLGPDAKVPEDALLILDGETPAALRWSLLLVGACLAFAIWNVVYAARLVRRIET
jgi:hypothetical protein